MNLTYFVFLVFLFSGVISAPMDSADASASANTPQSAAAPAANKNSDQAYSAKTLDSSILNKEKNIASSPVKDEKEDSSPTKDNNSVKIVQHDSSSPVLKSDVKSELAYKTEFPSALKPEDNKIYEVAKANQDNLKGGTSPDISVLLNDISIENEVVDKKENEPREKANDSDATFEGSKSTITYQLPTQKPGASEAIGTFIYELMQTPIYLLKAFKELIGGILGLSLSGTATVRTSGTA